MDLSKEDIIRKNIRVSVFENTDYEQLEKEINDFIEFESMLVIDLKFSSSVVLDKIFYSVLLMFVDMPEDIELPFSNITSK